MGRDDVPGDVVSEDVTDGNRGWSGPRCRLGTRNPGLETFDHGSGYFDGSWVTDNSFAETVNVRTDYSVEVVISGSTVTLSAGEIAKVAHSFTGQVLNDGRVGMGTHNSVATFNDFSVQAVSGPSSAMPSSSALAAAAPPRHWPRPGHVGADRPPTVVDLLTRPRQLLPIARPTVLNRIARNDDAESFAPR